MSDTMRAMRAMRVRRTGLSALMAVAIGQASLAALAADVPASAAPAASGASGMPLAVVLGQVDGSGTVPSHAARLQAVRALSKALSSNEVHALYGLLDRKSGEDPASSAERNALKNDVVNALKMLSLIHI